MEYAQKNPTIARMCRLGADVLETPEMQSLRRYVQHGRVTRYEHCLAVCYIAMRLAERLHLRVDERSMVRGALLHDFFMYDWHDRGRARRVRWTHGFTHPGVALRTAQKQFELNAIEQDVIKKHMFPLTPTPPRCREALIVSLADKISAVMETFGMRRAERIAWMCRMVGRA